MSQEVVQILSKRESGEINHNDQPVAVSGPRERVPAPLLPTPPAERATPDPALLPPPG